MYIKRNDNEINAISRHFFITIVINKYYIYIYIIIIYKRAINTYIIRNILNLYIIILLFKYCFYIIDVNILNFFIYKNYIDNKSI